MILGYDELPQEIKKYIPDYEYLIYDLTKYEDIKLHSITRIIIAIVKGMKEEYIVELTGLTQNEIDKIRKDMLQ
jgi:hypothetical protein